MKSAKAPAEEDLDKLVGVSCRRSGKAASCRDSKNHSRYTSASTCVQHTMELRMVITTQNLIIDRVERLSEN